MSVPTLQAQVDSLQTQVNNLQVQVSQDELDITNLQAEAGSIQSALASEPATYASAAANTLPAIPSSAIDGKSLRVTICGRAGSSLVRLFINGVQYSSVGTPGAGYSFIHSLILTWNSTTQDVWGDGSPSLIGSPFNPASFVFSTDANHTITDFSVRNC